MTAMLCYGCMVGMAAVIVAVLVIAWKAGQR